MFDALTGNKSAEQDDDIWEVITDVSDIDDILQRSNHRPQLIYKHSNRCSVCFVAKGNLERASEQIGEQAEMYYLDVVKHREASNYVADKLEVRHESPQVILVNEGEVSWNASHGSIDADTVLERLNGSS